jgi:4-phytase/acid phosphatase
MMKRFVRRWQFVAACAFFVPLSAAAADVPRLKVERVVMLMRHGIRPPTSLQPIPVNYSPMAWPKWPVGPGLLTPHGAKGIALLAGSDHAYFVRAGLLPARGCPAAGQVTVRASSVPRAVATAEAWTNAILPNCAIVVQHPAKGAPDPLFHLLEEKPTWFDGHRAYQAAIAAAPAGGLVAQARQVADKMKRMETILGCAAPGCSLEQVSTIVERKHGRPDLNGPLDVASTASESFLLEYLEGKPMGQVGWNRISPAEIEQLLVFNSIKFKYVDRPRFIAKAAAGPLAKIISGTLSAPTGSRVTLLAGHDTNIADLGGLLDMHWQAASYPTDAVPPGSALGFELVSDDHQRKFVRAFFRSQTMDQLRRLQPLNAGNPPYREYLDIPGCGNAKAPRSCKLSRFTELIEARLR